MGKVLMQTMCRGSAIQRAVSALTLTPSEMFQGSGQPFTTFGLYFVSFFCLQ